MPCQTGSISIKIVSKWIHQLKSWRSILVNSQPVCTTSPRDDRPEGVPQYGMAVPRI